MEFITRIAKEVNNKHFLLEVQDEVSYLRTVKERIEKALNKYYSLGDCSIEIEIPEYCKVKIVDDNNSIYRKWEINVDHYINGYSKEYFMVNDNNSFERVLYRLLFIRFLDNFYLNLTSHEKKQIYKRCQDVIDYMVSYQNHIIAT